METQVKLSQSMQWFIKIGIAFSGIIGLINVETASHKGGLELFIMVCIELFTLLYGLWLTKFLDK